MADHDNSAKPPVNIGMRDGESDGRSPGAAAENIMPPEQPPMDDAAGGPQADESDVSTEMPGENPVEGSDPQVPSDDI